ncbi:MAG: pilus assembly protein TadG-related protein, partial [Paracoccaceae bacterium]
ILVLMLIVSGMAVDFMRFESRRAELQGVVDRAVLAAADLDQARDPADVVTDYFDKSGMLGQMKGEPVITPGTDYRQVTANGELVLNTFFLKLIGMDQLIATASSTAIEGVGDIEISLVLDISGSMDFELVNDDGSTPTMVDPDTGNTRAVRRIDVLQEAAGNFVTTLLTAANADKISISLIPYSHQVNAGELMFDNLNTNDSHGFSHCIEFAATDFNSTTFDVNDTYDQTMHYQYNPTYDQWGNLAADITEPICPFYDYEAIVPLSQNAGLLTGIIDQYEPRAGTSIFLGLKWGVTMLDPSIQPVLAGMPNGTIDDAFDSRPAPYPADNAVGDTKKYIVLMTDGQNSNTSHLQNWAYDTPSEVAHWANENFWHFISTDTGWDASDNWLTPVYTPELGDGYMSSMCDAAKAPGRDIIIYTISLGSMGDSPEEVAADEHGWTQMRNCASSPSFFFKTSGEELVQIFEDIADQITDLRLTQ